MQKKQIAVLGSTGSIGTQALQVADHLGYKVVALAAYRSIELLFEQMQKFQPEIVAVWDEEKARELKKRAPEFLVVSGMEGLIQVATWESANLVVSSLSGAIGIAPTLSAIDKGKTIALANKEVLVAAGDLVLERAKQKKARILPVDSEHSALFQCLEHKDPSEIRRLILTASGGPFWRLSKEEKEKVSLEKALCHPSWNMGRKITIDSSTLMNKGLEVIEAFYLFQIPVKQIDVVIHPQSVIHSMVEMDDGSMFAQMSEPSMIIPIQYAMTWPERKKGILPPFPFVKYPKLEFFPMEKGSFPCLDLAYEALYQRGSFPCYLNAANEILVDRFLQGKIAWHEIGKKLEKLLSCHKRETPSTLEEIFAIDAMAREQAQTI